MDDLRRSYLSAGETPWKLLQARDAVAGGKILPLHPSLNLTNRCNATCKWCACRDVDRSLTMPTGEAIQVLSRFGRMGTRAVTITGGGEPTLHDGLGCVLHHCDTRKLKIGLVTNGVRWSHEGVPPEASLCQWIRVSVVDGHDAMRVVEEICKGAPAVGVGVSFTVTAEPDVEAAFGLCELANRTVNCTHIRFVQDILAPSDSGFRWVQSAVQSVSEKAIFQRRENFTDGANPCLVSRLKPFIDADGQVYPCCGVQYATDELRCLPKSMRICHWMEYCDARPFDGSICRRCFYGEYNRVLGGLVERLIDEAFV